MATSKPSFCSFFSLLFIAVLGVDDNYFYLTSNGTVSIAFSMASYDITEGETWDGLTVDANYVLIKADRKNSGEVAAYFVDGLNAADMFPTNNVVDVEPQDLNFAVIGNLSITLQAFGVYDCGSFRLGQGHYVGHNNWWLAFPSGATNRVVTCYKDGARAKLQFHGIADDTEYVLPY